MFSFVLLLSLSDEHSRETNHMIYMKVQHMYPTLSFTLSSLRLPLKLNAESDASVWDRQAKTNRAHQRLGMIGAEAS